MALRAVLGPWTQPQSRDSGATGRHGHVSAVSCQQTTRLQLGDFLLLTAVLIFKGLIPKSHIPACLDSELWGRVSALCIREILIFL